jgi:predicted ATPase/DNA-binding response OmpR family regulator
MVAERTRARKVAERVAGLDTIAYAWVRRWRGMTQDRSDWLQSEVKVGAVRVDLTRGLGRRPDGADLLFTDQERRILKLLVGASGNTVSRDELHEAVWGAPLPLGSRAVDVALHRLRAKLEDDARRPAHLLTVRGEGYRLVLGEAQLLAAKSPGERIVLPTCVIDLGARRIERQGRLRELGRAEVAVLRALATRPGKALSTRELLELGWEDSTGDAGRVRTAVMRLRKKIEADPAHPQCLVTRDGGFALVVDAAPGEQPTGSMALGDVPPRGDRFFGRQDELLQLEALFEGGARLVTLQAVGGCGKTRLATEFARGQLGPGWPGGVWFCDLTEAHGRSDLLSTVAATLALQSSSVSEADPMRALGESLARRGRTLLVLDNLEQFSEAASDVIATLMSATDDLCCLATSRVRLGLRDERTLRLEPLPMDDALDMLHERSEAAGDTAPDREALQRVVERLDALPLALELVAGYAALLSPDQLLARLERRLGLSATGSRDLPRRHATLRDTMEWSWRLLTPLEGRALAQCAVFRGAFTVEDAEQVMDLGSLAPGAGTLEALRILCDRSLLRSVRPDDPRAEPGFRMFEVVREFGEERLDELTARDDLLLSHETWYLSLGERLVERLEGADPAGPLARLALSADNLFDIFRRARRAPKVAARAGACLVPLLSRRGPGWRLKQVSERSVEAARRTGEPDRLARALVLRAEAGDWMTPAQRQADGAEATALAEKAGGPSLQARALLVEARALREAGSIAAADTRCQQAAALSDREGGEAQNAAALCELGRIQGLRDSDRATRTLHLALQFARRDGLRQREAEACLALAAVYRASHKLDDAEEAVTLGLEAAAGTGLPTLRAWLELEAAAVLIARGDLDAAATMLAGRLEDRMGNGSLVQAEARALLGVLSLLRGDETASLAQLQRARAGRSVAGYKPGPHIELWEGLGRMIDGAEPHAMLSGARAAADQAGDRVLSGLIDAIIVACETGVAASDAGPEVSMAVLLHKARAGDDVAAALAEAEACEDESMSPEARLLRAAAARAR